MMLLVRPFVPIIYHYLHLFTLYKAFPQTECCLLRVYNKTPGVSWGYEEESSLLQFSVNFLKTPQVNINLYEASFFGFATSKVQFLYIKITF